MTVGVAGACVHNGKHCIVMCCDWQGTYGTFVKSRDLYKLRTHGRFTIIIADEPTAADALIAKMLPTLRAYEQVDKAA
jgi:hypothetical protein